MRPEMTRPKELINPYSPTYEPEQYIGFWEGADTLLYMLKAGALYKPSDDLPRDLFHMVMTDEGWIIHIKEE